MMVSNIIQSYPRCPLHANSVIISVDKNYSDWIEQEHISSQTALQKIVFVWHQSRIAEQYMIYGFVSPHSTFHWEAIPFPSSSNFLRFFEQLTVLWKISFGSSAVSSEIREQKYHILQSHLQ